MRIISKEEFLGMAELVGEMVQKVRVQCPFCGVLLDQKGFCAHCAKKGRGTPVGAPRS